jgi:hypothetical protein
VLIHAVDQGSYSPIRNYRSVMPRTHADEISF